MFVAKLLCDTGDHRTGHIKRDVEEFLAITDTIGTQCLVDEFLGSVAVWNALAVNGLEFVQHTRLTG
jgi:hypothetical protein